jgi:hypothetical protein
MRLYPPVTKDEALVWLRQEAESRWGQIDKELEAPLDTLAQAMAAISAVEIPEDIEPTHPASGA